MAQVDNVEIKISQDLIKPILEQKIKSALVDSFDAVPKLTESIIDYYLNQTCNSSGVVSNYSSDNKFRRIDVLMRTLIEDAMKEQMKIYLEEHKETLALAISNHLKTKKGSAQIIQAIQDGMVKSMVANWRYNLQVILPTNY